LYSTRADVIVEVDAVIAGRGNQSSHQNIQIIELRERSEKKSSQGIHLLGDWKNHTSPIFQIAKKRKIDLL
jgi:hypothetical protein